MSKTISEKQLAANRANAQKSTGPKTEEGKARVAMNGMRHGLTGAAFIMSDEDRAVWDRFKPRIIADLKPVGEVERSFAELIAQDHFRLHRAQALEENTFALGHYSRAANFEADHPEIHHAMTQARVFSLDGKFFHNLSLYEQRMNRRMLNNMKALRELQDPRKAEEREAALEARKPKTFTANAGPQSDHENGFGFSCVQTPPQPTAETPPQEPKIAA